MRISDLISGVFRVGLACVFGYAAYQKLQAPEAADEFLSSLLRVEASGVAFVVGVAEALLALFLLLNIAPRFAARAAVLASGAFVTVHAYTMTLPEPPPPCGCLGASATQTAGADPLPWLWITGAMLFASAFLLWRAPAKPATPIEPATPEPEAMPA
jgi:uncharacterized membrane protein YphA (DoxX/SURF4 family)